LEDVGASMWERAELRDMRNRDDGNCRFSSSGRLGN